MRLHELSIQRPVLAVVMSIVIIVFGLIGLSELGVREFPMAQRPIISVQAAYPGASASVVESQITEPLEEELNTVSGIRTMTSISREGLSTVTAEFDLGDDLDTAANDFPTGLAPPCVGCRMTPRHRLSPRQTPMATRSSSSACAATSAACWI